MQALPTGVDDESEIEMAMLKLVAERGAAKTICPSEVARHLGGAEEDAWRPLMQPIRRVAVRLAEQGRVEMRRKGERVADPKGCKGIYRIGMPRVP